MCYFLKNSFNISCRRVDLWWESCCLSVCSQEEVFNICIHIISEYNRLFEKWRSGLLHTFFSKPVFTCSSFCNCLCLTSSRLNILLCEGLFDKPIFVSGFVRILVCALLCVCSNVFYVWVRLLSLAFVYIISIASEQWSVIEACLRVAFLNPLILKNTKLLLTLMPQILWIFVNTLWWKCVLVLKRWTADEMHFY